MSDRERRLIMLMMFMAIVVGVAALAELVYVAVRWAVG